MLAGIQQARILIVATPDSFLARRTMELAQEMNPGIDLVMRTHSEDEQRKLQAQTRGLVVMGERELARAMLEYTLLQFGRTRPQQA